MKQSSRLSAAGIVITILCAGVVGPQHAAAAPTVDWGRTTAVAAPSAGGESLQAGFQALSHKVAAEARERMIYGIPQNPQDAFAGVPACSSVDAMMFRAFTLDEAVDFLKPCADGLSQRYGLPVTIEQGPVGVDGCRSTTPGIIVHVPATINPGNHILMDLSYSLREKRNAKLLGFPAGIVSGTLYGRTKASAK